MGNEDVKAFTFFRSWWEALEKCDQSVVVEVMSNMCRFVFYDEWDLTGVSPMAELFLVSNRPTLEISIKKSIAGKAGGEKSKRPKANGTADKHTDKQEVKHPDKQEVKHPDKHTDNGEERRGKERNGMD